MNEEDNIQPLLEAIRQALPQFDYEVILVDDGLASGYTMMTAARMARRREPSQMVIAVPTASLSTIKLLAEEVESPAIVHGDGCHAIFGGASG